MNVWLIVGAFYVVSAVIVFVTLLASCVKAAEADERHREEEWREVMSVTVGDDEGRAA